MLLVRFIRLEKLESSFLVNDLIQETYVAVVMSSKHDATIIEIDDLKTAQREIEKIGSDHDSITIMAPKAVFRVIKLCDVVLQDAIIVKQDMLSLGGEVAVPKDTFRLHKKRGDILIMGTLQQLRALVEKLNRHYSRLQTVAKEISHCIEEKGKRDK